MAPQENHSGLFRSNQPFPGGAGRGPTYADGRIYAYGDQVMYAIDARTGQPVRSFGNKGRLLLLKRSRQVQVPREGRAPATGCRLPPPISMARCTPVWAYPIAISPVDCWRHRRHDRRDQVGLQHRSPEADRHGWEIAKDTWSGGQRAGGGIWTQPAIDPELGLLYINAGNPSPV